jgi:hypothetical protein
MRCPTVTRRLEYRAAMTALGGFAVLIAGIFVPWTGTASDAVAIVACAAWLGGSVVTVIAGFLRREQAVRRSRAADARRIDLGRTEGERQVRAAAHGDTVEAIKSDALRQAAALFGPDADLEIAGVEGLATAIGRDRGAFVGFVTVRMTPRAPAAVRPVETKAS